MAASSLKNHKSKMKKNIPEGNIPYEAGATLVDEGIIFKVPFYLGLKLTFNIKPLKPGTIARAGMHVCQMEIIDPNNNMSSEMFLKSKNIHHIASIMAHAVINCNIFKMWKFLFYKWIFMSRVESMQCLFDYFLIVVRQSDPSRFFFIMDLTRRIPTMEKGTVKDGEEKPSGGPLP